MIVAQNISKYYGSRAAVSSLSFKIDEHEVVGLLGLNGAGKTTVLRILSGLLTPTSGSVEVAGLPMAEAPEAVRSRIGFLPESPPLYGEMTVRSYLEFVGHIKGINNGLSQAVDHAMAPTELQDVGDQRIDTLSHGYRRRVGIAQAIVHRPDLILLDEPTSGLDPVQIVHMRKLVRGLKQRHTILVSTHLLNEIHEVCDRIFVLQDGKIAAEGSEEELSRMVAGTTRLHVEVRGSREGLSKALQGAEGVVGHHVETDSDGVIVAVVELAEDNREALANALVGAGLGLRRLERVQLELENIFLKLTGEGEAAA